ncbi:hypothetical protein Ndes2526B_g06900 [Nannochloris sp. 'desiccata']
MTRADDLAGGLAAGDTDARLKSLRAIKNSVIGSKREKTKHLLYLPKILEILSKDQEASVLIQAAQAIGSFAAAPDGAKAVIDQGGIPKVLLALKYPDNRVVEASARALKLLYTKTTDISQKEVQQLLQTPGAITTLIALLSSKDSPSMSESAAWIIAKCCEIDEEDAKVAFCNAGALQPLVQLLEDTRQRNRQAAALSAVNALTYNDLATCRNVLKHQNVVFNLLACVKSSTEDPRMRFTACVCLTNLAPALVSRFTSGGGGGGGGGGDSILPSREEVQETVLPVLVRLMMEDTPQHTHTLHHHERINSKQKTNSMLARPLPAALQPVATTKTAGVPKKNLVAAEIPGILLQLLSKNPGLQASAVDADAILRLTSLLQAPTTSPKGRVNSLLVLGMLTETVESHRRKLVDCGALPAIAAALADPSLSVRGAACCCMKSLSRSTRLLRCSLGSLSDIATRLLELSKNSDSSISTKAAATLANMAIEYSAIKEQVLVLQGITRFVELTEIQNNKKLQLYGIWGLSSAVYLSSDEVKIAVMKALSWSKVVEFLHGNDQEIKEKTLLLLRNLAHRGGAGAGAVAEAVAGPGGKSIRPATVLEWSQGQFLPQILEALNSVLEPPYPTLQSVKQFENALYSIVNIASGHAADKDAVSNLVMADLRPAFQAALHHEEDSIREAAVWVVINLTYIQDGADDDTDGQQRMEKRRQDLIAMGIAEDLMATRSGDRCMRVRERADTAYGQLSGSRRLVDDNEEEERRHLISWFNEEEGVIGGRRVARTALFMDNDDVMDEDVDEEGDFMDEEEDGEDEDGEGLPW